MISKPKILLFDEATSALDSVVEKEVQRNIDDRMKGNSLIVIAHRISTIKDSDIIFVFKDGSVVEQDNYDNLMSNKGEFYRIVTGSDEK